MYTKYSVYTCLLLGIKSWQIQSFLFLIIINIILAIFSVTKAIAMMTVSTTTITCAQKTHLHHVEIVYHFINSHMAKIFKYAVPSVFICLTSGIVWERYLNYIFINLILCKNYIYSILFIFQSTLTTASLNSVWPWTLHTLIYVCISHLSGMVLSKDTLFSKHYFLICNGSNI